MDGVAQLDLAYDLFKGLEQDSLGYIYRGLLTQKLTVSILSLTETSLSRYEDASKIKRTLFFLMMEGLQNITRYQDADRDSTPEKFGIFLFQKRGIWYYITTGNLIEKSKIPHLSSILDKVNSLDDDELKRLKKEVLTTGSLGPQGGAGLGLIEMSRKSGRKLLYDFKDIDDTYSYFYLHIDMPSNEEAVSSKDDHAENPFLLEDIKKLHATVNSENVLLNFNGLFTQDNLMDLLSIFEGQMKGRVMHKKKVFNIMVEMLQNLVKHADRLDGKDEGRPGIFFISEKGSKFYVNCGNYISNDKINNIKSKIDFANSMNIDQCNEHYNNVLSTFKIDDPSTSGLGIVDIRLKSEHDILYKIHPINDKYSFFVVQACV